MESMLEGMAEFYSANLSQNVKRGFRENALKGKWNGGSLPIGYKVVDHKLAVDEETAPIVMKIFEMSADGYTAKEIYDYLRQKQIRRPNGKEIAYNSVLHILKNRTYIGEYNHSGVFREDGVPAIVTKEMFEAAQENLQKHSFAPAAHNEENDYLLTTHLYCGKCGALMTAYSGTSEVGKVYRYYSCNQARKHKCDKKKISKEKIENFVVYKTMEFLQSDAIINRLSMLLFELQYKENTLLPRLDKQLADVEKQINNIITAIQKGVASVRYLKDIYDLEEAKNRSKRIYTKRKSYLSDVYERRIQNGFKQSEKDRYKNESWQRKIDRNFYR